MATYYVSATTGADINNGLSVGNALATIGAAENKATSAGDIVYIAPGTYREQVSHAYSGTANDRIYFIGDPDCQIFPDTIPQGIVRITISTTDNMGSATGRCIDSNSNNYIVWKNIHLDGGSSGISAWNDENSANYGVYCDSQGDRMEIHNSHFQNLYYGVRRGGTIIDCTMVNVERGVWDAYTVDRTTIISTYIGCYNVDQLKNSVILAYYGAYNCNLTVNCMFPAAVYPNYSTSLTDYLYDSIAGPGAYYGFGSPSSNTSRQTEVSGSYLSGARYMSRYGHLHGYVFGFIGRYQWASTSNEPYKGKGGDANMSTSGVKFDQAQMHLYSINDIRKITAGFRASMFTEGLQGRTTTFTEGTITDEHGFSLASHELTNNVAYQLDIEGRTRKHGIARGFYMEDTSYTSSSRDIGPYEYTDTFLTCSYSSSLPAITFSKGQYQIPFFISASQTFTASLEMKFVKGDAPSAPHFYRPEVALQQTVTDSSASLATYTVSNKGIIPSSSAAKLLAYTPMTADDQWQKLEVSQSGPPVGTEYELIVTNHHSGSSYVIVSNIEIR